MNKNPKKIIYFHINASTNIGLGHLYRSIAIAEHLKNYFIIIFIGNIKTKFFFDKFEIKYKYFYYTNMNNFYKIIRINKPNIIINDRLDNSYNYVLFIKKFCDKIINFEDNGKGNNFADLSINELNYEKTNNKKKLYGFSYFLLRKEFLRKQKNQFNYKINKILITFGGTDPSNYTLKTINLLNDISKKLNILLFVVIGPGYKNKIVLKKHILKISNKNINLYESIGKMSQIMSKVDFAFSSNGRTVLELAQMNIPGIIIDQNKRESTHLFWKISKGFYNFKNFDTKNEQKIYNKFKLIFNDHLTRKKLYNNLLRYDFKLNKYRIIESIIKLINK
ncbi:hypothetical protein OAQ39_02280 [Alphaproteobacteria bacterium]|nr:hypothetical protein [Alphaproteobacteria bacterium]